MIHSLTIPAILMMTFAPVAVAEAGFYAEAGHARYGIDIVEQDFNPGAFQVRGGYMLNSYFGVELEGTIGIHDDSVSDAGSRLTIELDHTVAASLVGRLPLSERLQIIGRIGHQTINLKVSGEAVGEETVRQSGNDDGVVLGAGLEYRFEQFGLRADYTRSDEASPFPASDRIEVFSIGLSRKF